MTDFYDDYDEEELDEIIERSNSKKSKPAELNIPEFLTKRDNEERPQVDEEISATLNNVPNSVEIENINHLNELEQVCQNWSTEEWKRVLYYVPSSLMTEEIQRRLSASEEYRRAMVDADEVMRKLKL